MGTFRTELVFDGKEKSAHKRVKHENYGAEKI
jgi:hypothetical protein